jgi:hypothetical protein
MFASSTAEAMSSSRAGNDIASGFDALHFRSLDLETLGSSATTTTLELATLALDVWLLALMGTHTEVLDGLAGVLGTTEEDNVATSRVLKGELIEGQALTACSLDASASRRSEAKSSDGQLGDCEETVVIGDGTDNGDSLTLVCLLSSLGAGLCDNSGDRDGRSVDS